MSTRCQIKLRSKDSNFTKNSESKIYIYKHSDGYPEGVLPTLIPFVIEFHKERGCDDGAYLLCQLVRRFAVEDYLDTLNEPDPEFKKHLEKYRFLGWGLDCEKHGDIDYLYEIDSEGNIYVNDKKLTESEILPYRKDIPQSIQFIAQKD